MTKAKKLIEVALPIKEISAESVRDKSIRHGHISTLHLWWARRPLPVCRAVIFASLVPDPLDANCPKAFVMPYKICWQTICSMHLILIFLILPSMTRCRIHFATVY